MKIEVDKEELEIIIRGLNCMNDELYDTARFYGRKLGNLIERLEKEYKVQ